MFMACCIWHFDNKFVIAVHVQAAPDMVAQIDKFLDLAHRGIWPLGSAHADALGPDRNQRIGTHVAAIDRQSLTGLAAGQLDGRQIAGFCPSG